MKYHGIIFSLGNPGPLQNRPLGPHRIATELRILGWDIEVVDFAIHWPLEELKELTRKSVGRNTKFIGLGQVFTFWNESIELFLKWIKSEYPNLLVILGAMNYSDTGSNYVDYYVQGYGENSLIKILEHHFSNGEKPNFKIRDSNKVIFSEEEYPSTPKVNPSVFYENRDFIETEEWLSVEFSRGCKFQCKFCNFPVLGVKGDYTRNEENYIEQLNDAYDRFGVTNYLVTDETFNDTSHKVQKFADATQKLKFQPYFTGYIRSDLLIARPQDQEHLLRMNFLGQFYGVESFNYESGKVTGKGMHPDKLKQGLLELKNYYLSRGNGLYRSTISLIAGLPYETHQSLDETENWILKNWTDQAFIYFPLSLSENDTMASELSNDMEKYGYKKIENDDYRNLDKNNKYGIDQYSIPWENDYMDVYQAFERIQKFYEKYYWDQSLFKLDNFSLTDKHTKDIKGLLDFPANAFDYGDIAERDAQEKHEFLRRYIQNKLNVSR